LPAFVLLLPLHAASGQPLSQTSSPTPAPVPGGHAKANGVGLYCATIGDALPVVRLRLST